MNLSSFSRLLGAGRGRRRAARGKKQQHNERQARLRVDERVDLAALIAAVERDTDLVAFAYEPPTLSELFREAVAA